MLKPNTIYAWELETNTGQVISQYNPDGQENTWKSVSPDSVVRFSFIPTVNILPRHDAFIDASVGEKFIKRFARGFMRQNAQGIQLKEYVNCCVTNRYRFWVFSNGRALVTRADYEVYL